MKRAKRARRSVPRGRAIRKALGRVIERGLAYLRAHPEESVQAGLATFLPASGGAARARFLSNLVATQDPEGHWHHSLAETAWNLRLLHDLGEHRTPTVYRAVEWVFSTLGEPARNKEELVGKESWAGQPGAFARGCSQAGPPQPADGGRRRAAHRARLCERFLGPCFNPGETVLHRVRFPNGAEATEDAEARFLISNVALEALLRWGYDRDPRLERCLESLRNFSRLHSRHGRMFEPVVMVSVLAALLRDRHPRSKKQAGTLLRALAKLQKRDATWPRLDRFYVLDVIAHSRNRHAQRMLSRSVPRLIKLAGLPAKARLCRQAGREGNWGTGALATGIALRAVVASARVRSGLEGFILKAGGRMREA